MALWLSPYAVSEAVLSRILCSVLIRAGQACKALADIADEPLIGEYLEPWTEAGRAPE
jgi:hypothetical protein